MKRKPYRYLYMLHSSKPDPSAGDAVSIYLMAYSRAGTKFSSASVAKLSGLRDELPSSEGEYCQWGPWICLWASAEHTLGRMDRNEAYQIADRYTAAVAATKSILLRTA